MRFCSVSWEIYFDLTDCCPSDMERIDVMLSFTSFFAVFEPALVGFLVANSKTNRNVLTKSMF